MDVIFKEIKSDFDGHPKNVVTPIFVDVFERLTIVPEKVLPNIISCNCTVLAALHQLYDNIIFGMILKQLFTEQKVLLEKATEENSG